MGDETIQFRKLLADDASKCLSAHSAKGIFGIKRHHHGFVSAQVHSCLQYLSLRVGPFQGWLQTGGAPPL
eukprot:12892329-Prorocentrum_lima.AAC.1